jgi:hypothetical protein
MYKVTCDGKLLHSDDLQGLKIVDGELSLELGKTGAFDFIIYPQHPYYEYVKPVISIVEVYRNELSIFRGRVLNIKYGFYNEKQVSCEGELAFLLDSIQRPWEFNGSPEELFRKFIEYHNSQMDSERQFTVGNITVTDANNYIAISNISRNCCKRRGNNNISCKWWNWNNGTTSYI